MITVQPTTYNHVSFDPIEIADYADKALAMSGLPVGLDIELVVDEVLSTNRVRVESVDPVKVVAESGALENYQVPRTVGELPTLISLCRLFLEVGDRRSETFGAPSLDSELAPAHRMAWDVALFGRVAQLGLSIHQPRYRYNFRNRHGFSDTADGVFDTLWLSAPNTWAGIVDLSDQAQAEAA